MLQKIVDKMVQNATLVITGHFICFQILAFQGVIFELEYRHSNKSDLDIQSSGEDDNRRILLRGQMKFVKQWNMMAFLCTPL